MRYSEVLSNFYKIELMPDTADFVDTHFTSAGHHIWRLREALARGDHLSAELHHQLLLAHSRKLRAFVYFEGNFNQAEDSSVNGLDERSAWHPSIRALPDQAMFNSFMPDPLYTVGEGHPGDVYLDDLIRIAPPSGRNSA